MPRAAEAIRIVAALAPDGDWVRTLEVARSLGLTMDHTVDALDVAVERGALESRLAEFTFIDAFGVPTSDAIITTMYRLKTLTPDSVTRPGIGCTRR